MTILKQVKQALKRRAVIQKEIEAIDRMFTQLGPIKGGGVKASDGRKTRKPMSAAGRAKIAAAARERWKKAKAAGKNSL